MHLPEWLEIALRCTVVYLALLVALRLAGKRHAGQLSPHDFVLILLVSNAVQNAMVGAGVSLAGGLTAAGVLIFLNVLITRFVLRRRRWARLLAGRPTLLVYNGRVLWEDMAHEGILEEELLAQLRAHGYEGPERVRAAVQECDGSISVIGLAPSVECGIPPGTDSSWTRQQRPLGDTASCELVCRAGREGICHPEYGRSSNSRFCEAAGGGSVENEQRQ